MARLYGRWNVTLPDEKYEFDFDDITLGEQHLLESELPDDMTFEQWVSAIDARRAQACQVLIWFLRRRNGQQQELGAVDFPIRRLVLEPIADVEDEAIADPEAPAGSEPATS